MIASYIHKYDNYCTYIKINHFVCFSQPTACLLEWVPGFFLLDSDSPSDPALPSALQLTATQQLVNMSPTYGVPALFGGLPEFTIDKCMQEQLPLRFQKKLQNIAYSLHRYDFPPCYIKYAHIFSHAADIN